MKQTRFIIQFYSLMLLFGHSVNAQIRTIDIHGSIVNRTFSDDNDDKKGAVVKVNKKEELPSSENEEMNKNKYYFFENKKRKQEFYPPLRKMQATSGYGYRHHPVVGGIKFHSGVDLKAYYETVYSIADGIVEKCGYDDVSGNYIIINHGKIKTGYCHLSRFLKNVGDIVKGGSAIGISGNTGRSTGPHLHFGVKYFEKNINPALLSFIFKSDF